MLDSYRPNSLDQTSQRSASFNMHDSHHPYDLSNLAQIQNELEQSVIGQQQKALGFHIIQTSIRIKIPTRLSFDRGILNKQIIIQRNGIHVTKTETCQLTKYDAPQDPQCVQANAQSEGDPEEAIEAHLRELTRAGKPRDYLMLTGHHDEVRNSLGLPERGLHAGDQLMRWTQHLSGIHSEYLYCSRDYGTVAEMHREDGDLHSANILYTGNPKLWVFICPCSRNTLEYRLQKHFSVAASCSQFVRHLHCLPPPSILREWGILFSVRRQYPGDLVLLLPDVYHYVINEGVNLAGAINYSEPDWQLNNLYTDCTQRCAGDNAIAMKQLATSLAPCPRALDVRDFEPARPPRPHQKRRAEYDESFRHKANVNAESQRCQIIVSDDRTDDEDQNDRESNITLTSDSEIASSSDSTALSSVRSIPEPPNRPGRNGKTSMSSSFLQMAQKLGEGDENATSETNNQPEQPLREVFVTESGQSPSSNKRARLDSASDSPPCREVPFDHEISIDQTQNLTLLRWDQLFQAFQQGASLSSEKIYWILAVASIPGNVEVLEQLQSILCETRYREELQAPISTFAGLWNRYTLVKTKSALSKLQQTFSEVQIARDYLQREFRIRQRKEAEKRKKSHQVQEIDQSNKRIATLILDEVEQEIRAEQGPNDTFRRSYNRAKQNGLTILSLADLFGIPEPQQDGFILLLPIERTRCALDDRIDADIRT